jgi:SAM-dependent methyltransferase
MDPYPMKPTGFNWTPDFWQAWRESGNPYHRYKSERDRQLVLDSLQLRDGDRVLEVGCGYGWISEALWNAAKIEWFGVDRSEEMLRHLHAASSGRMPRTSVADACRLPFQDGQFDKVLCTGVLMHISHDLDAVRELIRVLRPGGLLVCSFNNVLSLFSLPVRLWNLQKKGFVQKYRFLPSLRRILSSAGINSLNVTGDGIFATVSFSLGRFSFPPAFLFPVVRKMDQWAVRHFPWLAYEIWFCGIKARQQDMATRSRR